MAIGANLVSFAGEDQKKLSLSRPSNIGVTVTIANDVVWNVDDSPQEQKKLRGRIAEHLQKRLVEEIKDRAEVDAKPGQGGHNLSCQILRVTDGDEGERMFHSQPKVEKVSGTDKKAARPDKKHKADGMVAVARLTDARTGKTLWSETITARSMMKFVVVMGVPVPVATSGAEEDANIIAEQVAAALERGYQAQDKPSTSGPSKLRPSRGTKG